MAATNPKLAVFIDCENLSVSVGSTILTHLPRATNPSIKRAYGDAKALGAWSTFLKEHGFRAILSPPSAK